MPPAVTTTTTCGGAAPPARRGGRGTAGAGRVGAGPGGGGGGGGQRLRSQAGDPPVRLCVGAGRYSGHKSASGSFAALKSHSWQRGRGPPVSSRQWRCGSVKGSCWAICL